MSSDMVPALLREFEYGVQMALSDVYVNAPEFEWSRDPYLRATTVHALLRVTGEVVSHYEYPADWWQAVKQRWAPRWAQRRWKPRMTVLDARVLYPMVSLPHERHVVTFDKGIE